MKTPTLILKVFVLLLVLGAAAGCSTFGRKMKSFLGGGEEPKMATHNTKATKYSENPTVNAEGPKRLYRRVTRESFERDGLLEDNSGSLWVMEGQGSYLFSSNMVRLTGDLVNIELDGGPRSQLVTKVDVIKKLMEKNRRDAKREIAAAQAQAQAQAAQKAQAAVAPKEGEAKSDGAQAPGPNTAVNSPDANKDDKEEKEETDNFDVTVIPSRIVEKMSDGSYKVRGFQQFMIGKKEYKVIATGLVRPNDIRDDTIPASKILDAKFDIVSSKKELR